MKKVSSTTRRSKRMHFDFSFCISNIQLSENLGLLLYELVSIL